eukprot:4227404-Lingulodinium_polyedra.AAC.1
MGPKPEWTTWDPLGLHTSRPSAHGNGTAETPAGLAGPPGASATAQPCPPAHSGDPTAAAPAAPTCQRCP